MREKLFSLQQTSRNRIQSANMGTQKLKNLETNQQTLSLQRFSVNYSEKKKTLPFSGNKPDIIPKLLDQNPSSQI